MKVGDWVVATEDWNSWGYGPKMGVPYQITCLEYDGSLFYTQEPALFIGLVCEFPDHAGIAAGDETNWPAECFRLATPEEIAYFNFPNRLIEVLGD